LTSIKSRKKEAWGPKTRATFLRQQGQRKRSHKPVTKKTLTHNTKGKEKDKKRGRKQEECCWPEELRESPQEEAKEKAGNRDRRKLAKQC